MTAKKPAAKAAPAKAAGKAPAPVAPVAGVVGAGGEASLEADALANAGREDDQGDAGEAEGDATPLAEGTVAVTCAKRLSRFFRAGMRFGREPTVLVVADLPEGVLDRLKAEPNLVVREPERDPG